MAKEIDQVKESGAVSNVAKSDMQKAVAKGIIDQGQADALWDFWKPARVSAGPSFGFNNVLYYFGGLLAIGAMSLFMTLGWSVFGPWGLMLLTMANGAGCALAAKKLSDKGYRIPAGILGALSVALVPLAIWCAQHALGLWPDDRTSLSKGGYSAYHAIIDFRWIFMELGTLAAGVAMLWALRLPFMTMPIAVTIWYMSMDVAQGLAGHGSWNWELGRSISLAFGLATIVLAAWVDARSKASSAEVKGDFAYWLYLFGAIMAWSGLTLSHSGSELGKLAYGLVNLAMVFGGAAIKRGVFTSLGGLGVAFYIGDLSHRLFGNSVAFAFCLMAIGLGVVAMGVWWQRNEESIHASLAKWVPEALR